MAPELVAQQVTEYLEQLVPARTGEMGKMESYGVENRFPIIGPVAGYLCYQVARMIGAKRVFELGSGYGYSTAWFAKAVQENGGGVVHHVVWDEKLSAMARKHLDELGYGEIVRYHVGEAVAALTQTEGPFDLIFNDIDKEAYPTSLREISKKLRPGGVLIIDNMLWSGKIFDENDQSESTRGVREVTRMLTEGDEWISSLIPVRDGVIVAMKR
jgi:caffeoyl-CoA O-methyltransferase